MTTTYISPMTEEPCTKAVFERDSIRSRIWDAGIHTSESEMKANRKVGTWTARFGYFYRHGLTAQVWAERMAQVDGITVVDSGDAWNAWPKESYFWVEFRVTSTGEGE